MRLFGKRLTVAEEFAKVKVEIQKLEDKKKDLQKRLETALKDGEKVAVTWRGQKFIVAKEKEEKAVLVGNDEIYKTVGDEAFLKVAKVGVTALKSLLGKSHTFLIDHYETAYTVKLRRAK